MNNLKIVLLFLISIITFNVDAQLELDRDANHELSYSVENDTVYIFIDVFNDLTIDLDADGILNDDDDFVYLMWDLNANGQIDLTPSLVDIYYTLDSSQDNNLCNGHIVSPANITSCSGSSGGWAKVELKATANNATPHVFYTFAIPKVDVDLGGAGALCGRISTKVHTGGTPISSSATFPTYGGANSYFVEPYNSIQLYPEAVIMLPNGEPAPDDAQVSVCVGDTLSVYDGYPDFFWSGLFDTYYQIVLDIPTSEYGFFIKDPNDDNCFISDTVNVILLDDKFCRGAYRFPNTVSPNGDGVNDVFGLIIGQDLLAQNFWQNSKLKVYNRWGLKLFESPDNSNPIWDLRTDRGKLVPPGTYFYTYSPPGEGSETINGFFTVIHEE